MTTSTLPWRHDVRSVLEIEVIYGVKCSCCGKVVGSGAKHTTGSHARSRANFSLIKEGATDGSFSNSQEPHHTQSRPCDGLIRD